MVSGGAEAIEIFAARGHFNYSDRQHVREIANWFRSTGISVSFDASPMHGDDECGRSGAPPLNIAAVEKRDRIAAMDEIKRAIEVAEQCAVSIPGTACRRKRRDRAAGQKLEAAMTSLEHLRAFAKPLGVQVVVENIPNELSTPEGLVELLRTARFTDIGVCFDVGHAHLGPGITRRPSRR